MAGSAAPIIGSAVRASGGSAGRSSGSGSSGSNSSRSGSSGGRSSQSSGGSSASAGKQAQRAKKSRICKTCPKWRYRVGARYLGGVLGYNWYHLFVVAWDRKTSGLMPTYSAFPSGEGDASILGAIGGMSASDSSKTAEEGHTTDPNDDSDFGTLDYKFSADYLTSGEASPSNKFVTLRDTNANYNTKLITAAMAVDAKKIKYVPTGPNSNSFAMTIVKKAGLPQKHPSIRAPGAGMNLL